MSGGVRRTQKQVALGTKEEERATNPVVRLSKEHTQPGGAVRRGELAREEGRDAERFFNGNL